MKVAIIYEGWENDGKGCNRISGKIVIAGMEKSEEFHAKREARIRRENKADEIEIRILNGDGDSWIKEPYDPDVVYQLDRFHIYQCIRRNIAPKEAQGRIIELFEEERYDEMFAYINQHADSVESNNEKDKSNKKASKGVI